MARFAPSTSALRYLASCLDQQTSPTLCSLGKHRHLYIAPPILRTSFHPTRRRPFSTTTHHHDDPVDTSESPDQPQRRIHMHIRPERLSEEYTLDQKIPTRRIQLKNPNTGRLDPPTPLHTALRSIDRRTHVIRALNTHPDPTNPSALTICEITTKQSLLDRIRDSEIRAVEQAKALRGSKPKQIELNWAISENDLALKMKQMVEFLEKGKRVEILLASKKRQRKASVEEAEGVVSEIRRVVSEIDGAREAKAFEGKIGGQAVMIVQKDKR